MTDLEMTRLCAKAMGLDVATVIFDNKPEKNWSQFTKEGKIVDYDPLHDDAQAMALVKKLDLRIDREHHGKRYAVRGSSWDTLVMNADLNRAIVKCCAHMQERK